MPALSALLVTNLVCHSVLGEIKTFADKEGISLSTNLDAIVRFEQSEPTVSGHVTFKNGWYFSYRPGGIDTVQAPYSLINTINRGEAEGQAVVVSEKESINLARKFVEKLGISTEEVFMDLPPQVNERGGWGGAKWLELVWYNPALKEMPSVKIEVNCSRGLVSRGFFLHPRFSLNPVPKVTGYDPSGNSLAENARLRRESALSGERPESQELISGMTLSDAQRWNRSIGLKLGDISTNDVVLTEWVPLKSNSKNSGLEWLQKITLKSNWSFEAIQGTVISFKAPDTFFFRWDIKARDYIGKSHVSDSECLAFVSLCLESLGKHDLAEWIKKTTPDIGTPKTSPEIQIPRRWFEWQENLRDGILRRVSAEVDTGGKSLKSLYVYDGRVSDGKNRNRN